MVVYLSFTLKFNFVHSKGPGQTDGVNIGQALRL